MALNRALVVDDSRLARVALSKLLTRRGLEVDVASSGGEALDHLRHSVPDVVFLDYMMPDMDGFEAAQAIQQLPDCPPLPLVMYTSQDSDNDRARAEELGICGFLSKPTSEEGLHRVLQAVEAWQPVATAGTASSTEPPPEPEPEPTPESAAQFAPQPAAPVSVPDIDIAAIEERAVEAARSAATDAAETQVDEASIQWQQQLDRLVADMREALGDQADGDTAVTPSELEQSLASLREEIAAARQDAVREASEAARGAAQHAAADAVAQLRDVLHKEARSAAAQAVATALAQQEPTGGGNEGLEEQVDALLAQRLQGLADNQAFREQLIASLKDHGIPVLKNALEQWVQDRAAEAAGAAVEAAVESASEAMLREAAAAAAEEAAAEAHAAHARTRRFTLLGGLVLAVGVLAALLLAV